MKWHRHAGLLLQAALFVANCLAENLVLDVSFRKPIAVTSDAFLSLTVDPATLFRNADNLAKNIVASTNMARGLAPAYIRLGGPQSNSYIFERTCSNGHGVDSGSAFCEMHWMLLHEWAQNAGLDVIACIAPRSVGNVSQLNTNEGPTSIVKFVAFSDDMGYNVNLQVGYESQTRCDLSGENLGRHVANLREILRGFPRYSDSLITGPDIVSYETTRQQKYIEDYLTAADAALSAITWHPNFASASLSNGNITVDRDNIANEKDELYKIISRAAKGKPLWIAESRPEKYIHRYLGALVWTRRLGNSAKLGAQVVMRQPLYLHKTTPDYWVSLLHKRLVGREVLEVRPRPDNGDRVYLYAQCTKPSALYGRGAVTVFGVNFTPGRVIASLKGFRITTLHTYILSSDPGTDEMSSEHVLLNNKPLDLIDDEELPDLNPEITVSPDGLKLELPPFGIGFWVIPDAKARACTDPEEEAAEGTAVRRVSKRHESLDGRRENEEGKEEDPSSNVNNRKTHARRERRKRKHVESEDQQTVRGSKFLSRISKILRKRLEQAGDSPKLQRSIAIDLGGGQGSSEETEEDSHLDDKPDDGDASRGYNKHGEAVDSGRSGRGRRDLDRKVIELAARKDNIRRKNSRDVRDYISERRSRRRDDSRKEGFAAPFNPRTVTSRDDGSGENNFYGFARQPPVNGFPEGDVYGTVGNSSERTRADYDYVQDDESGVPPKDTGGRGEETSPRDHAANTRLEHGDHAPNEFFENVKLSRIVKGSSKDYGDLWEAESAKADSSTGSEERMKTEKPPGSPYSPDSARDLREARAKRSSEQRIREILTEEMFREGEGDAKNRRCRVIRGFGSPEGSGNRVADCSSEVESATGRQNVGDPETEGEEHGEGAMGEVTANDIEASGAKTPIGESGELDYGPSNVMRIVSKTTAATSAADDTAERDNYALERAPRYRGTTSPVTVQPVSPTPSEFSVNTDGVITKRTFFPIRSPVVRTGSETTALGTSAQSVPTSSADTAETRGRYSYVVVSAAAGTAQGREKTKTGEKETAESVTLSMITDERRKNERRYKDNSVEYLGESMRTADARQVTAEANTSELGEDNEEITITRSPEVRPGNAAHGTSRGVTEATDAERVTTKVSEEDDEKVTIARSPEIQPGNAATTRDISQVATGVGAVREVADESIDNTRLDKPAVRRALRQKGTDRNSEMVARGKDADTSKSNAAPPTLHGVPLRRLTKYEEYLIRRAEQIDKKLKERLARRERS